MENAKKIEVVLAGVALAVSLGASATAFAATNATGCDVTSGGVAVTGVPTNFIKDTFTPKCSTGVLVIYTDFGSGVSVRSGNVSGMHTFGGSSEGGGVIQCESSSVASPTSGLTAGTTNGCT